MIFVCHLSAQFLKPYLQPIIENLHVKCSPEALQLQIFAIFLQRYMAKVAVHLFTIGSTFGLNTGGWGAFPS